MNDLKATTYPNEEKSYTYDLFNNNPYVEFHENGNKRIEINFKGGLQDGLLHGSWKCWYESSQIKAKANYKDGKLDGLCTSWYEGGQKSSEINYSKGVKNGRLILWHRDGGKKSEVTYSDGRMNSLWVSWHKSGQIQKAVLFKDQKKVSKACWYDDGQIKTQVNYEPSHRALHELPETDWDSWPYNTIDMGIDLMTGKPIKIKINPYRVLMISKKSWYKNGNVKNEWAHYVYHYVDIGWYESGQLKYNHGHDDTLPNGSMCWHENGQLSYRLEPGTDKYISFNVNGSKEYELETRYTFDNDDFWKEKYTFFDKKGDKLCSIERDDDTLICLWYFYDKSGNKIYSNYYDYDKDAFEKDGIWQFWINQDIPELTKILTPIEKHKGLFCNPIFL